MLRKRTKQLLITIVSILLLAITFSLFNASPTQAYTNIPDKNIKKIATFKLQSSNSHQGGVVTEKYFIYLDCVNHCSGGGKAVIINRNTCELVKKVNLVHRYLSGPSYKWGSGFVSLIAKGNKVGCIKLNGKNSSLTSPSKCSKPEGAILNAPGSPQGAPTNFNGYRFKVAGLNTPTAVGVFQGSPTNKIKEFRIPEKYGEPEGISIDGKTGEVYIDFDKRNPRRAIFYKIDYKGLQKYTGKKKSSDPVKCSAIGKASGGGSSSSKDKDGNKTNPVNGRRPTVEPYEQPTAEGNEGNLETTFFGNYEDDGEGCGVYMILKLFVDILTYGIAIAATIGIVVSGITYLTARDNPSQVTKAKRRLLEIIIGLIAYLTLWSIINFVLPGGIFNGSDTCKESTQTTSRYGQKPTYIPSQSNGTTNNKDSSKSGSICKAPSECSWSERIAQTAELLAWPKKTPKSKYYKTMYGREKCFSKWSQLTKGHPTKAFQKAFDKVYPSHWKDCKRKAKKWGNGPYLGASCDKFAGTVVEYSGYDKNIGLSLSAQVPHLRNSKKWKKVSKPKRGDFCNRSGHSSIYLGKNKVAQAHYRNTSIGGLSFGHIESGSCSGMDIFRVTKKK